MNRRVQVFIGVAIVALSILRIYNAKQQKKERAQHQQMIRDLSNQQLHDRIQQDIEITLPSAEAELDSIQKGLDEIGEKLEDIGKNLEEMNQGN